MVRLVHSRMLGTPSGKRAKKSGTCRYAEPSEIAGSAWAIVETSCPCSSSSKMSDCTRSNSLVDFTGRNLLRGTAIAREPAKTSMAAPMADSIWITGVEVGSVGSTDLRLTMIGSPRMPPRSANRPARASRSTHRLLA